MATRGSISKEKITEKILEIFPGSFINDKEIRIPMLEDDFGEVQIKINLVAAKENIEHNGAGASINPAFESAFPEPVKKEMLKASEEEKAAVKEMMKNLGF